MCKMETQVAGYFALGAAEFRSFLLNCFFVYDLLSI